MALHGIGVLSFGVGSCPSPGWNDASWTDMVELWVSQSVPFLPRTLKGTRPFSFLRLFGYFLDRALHVADARTYSISCQALRARMLVQLQPRS